MVYIGASDHNLHAFDAVSGAVRWTAPMGADFVNYSSPAVANGVVYIGSSDHDVYAFDASTGARLWTAASSDWVVSSPTVADGVVYVATLDHLLYAFGLP